MSKPTPLPITLDQSECDHATWVAIETEKYNKERGLKPGQADPNKTAEDNKIGCYGEAAVSKAVGLPYTREIGNFKAKDVGDLQVRSRREPWHELPVGEHELDDDPFVLVWVPENDRAHTLILGWAWGREVKRHGYEHDWGNGVKRWLRQEYLREFRPSDFPKGRIRRRGVRRAG